MGVTGAGRVIQSDAHASPSGKPLALCATPDYRVEARDAAGPWESLTVAAHEEEGTGHQLWSLRAHHGGYLSARPDGCLEWNGLHAGSAELFAPEYDEARRTFVLRTCHGLFVVVNSEGRVCALAGPGTVFVNRPNPWAQGCAVEAKLGRFTPLRSDEVVQDA
jgi:hypothetical protein